MIFLIEYNRRKGSLVTFKRFKDSQRKKAQEERFNLELDLKHKKINHEVVLLEAAKESMIRRTHRRYFESLAQIAGIPGT